MLMLLRSYSSRQPYTLVRGSERSLTSCRRQSRVRPNSIDIFIVKHMSQRHSTLRAVWAVGPGADDDEWFKRRLLWCVSITAILTVGTVVVLGTSTLRLYIWDVQDECVFWPILANPAPLNCLFVDLGVGRYSSLFSDRSIIVSASTSSWYCLLKVSRFCF